MSLKPILARLANAERLAEAEAEEAFGIIMGGEATPAGLARTLTLEVTPEGAERVAVAMRLGRLSLIVRAMEDGPATAGAPRPVTVFASDVSPALARDAEQGLRMRIIQGGEDREVTFR